MDAIDAPTGSGTTDAAHGDAIAWVSGGTWRAVGELAAGARALGLLRRPDHAVRTVRTLRGEGANVAGLLRDAARRWPYRTALHDDAGSLGYRELDAAADAVAQRVVAALTIARSEGDDRARVGVVCGDDRRFVAAVVGTLRAGADPVPIDPAAGAEELADVMAHERIVLAVHDGRGAPALAAAAWVGPALCADGRATGFSSGPQGLELPELTGTTTTPAPPRGRLAGHRRAADTAAADARTGRVLLLTAGTAGPPRVPPCPPAATTTRALPRLGLLAAMGLTRGEAVLLAAPLFHSHGFTALEDALLVGSPVVLAGERNGEALCTVARRYGATVIVGAPVHLQRLADHLDHDCTHSTPLALRRVVSGSARLRSDIASRLARHLGRAVVDLFGSTASGVATVASWRDRNVTPGSVGRPLPGVRVGVVADDGTPLVPGAEGCVVVAARGPAGGWVPVRTGDRGYLVGDRLVLTGRADAVVVAGGENVLPREVEGFLATVSGVADVAVGPVADAVFGTRLVADVVLEPGGPLTPDTAPHLLRTAVRDSLAPHKVPRVVRVVDRVERRPLARNLVPAGR